ncbi:toll/interleukin-1 receptor domain-containing protein [Cryptosporangium minutisporangium]|uniref:TIR domain-containing protein n=1 Tax=Cryptosporangium minutisporangium TaxID=113569 RepID=A0ABP6TCK5_9ACTN
MSEAVFLSYSRADRLYAEKLAAFLEAAGVEVWWDFELRAGDRFVNEIETRIEASAAFIVLLSTSSVDSKWVQRELHYADAQGKEIVPLLLEECRTPFLTAGLHYEDVRGGIMPSAKFIHRLPRTRFSPDQSIIDRFTRATRSITDRLHNQLEQGEAVFQGETPDWLLTLSAAANVSIDATSVPSIDGPLDGSFWHTPMATIYLQTLRAAVARGVVVRRIFIFDDPQLAADETFLQICSAQHDNHISVKVLTAEMTADVDIGSIPDFVLFDDSIGHVESLVPGVAGTKLVRATLHTSPARVHELRRTFDGLWEAAAEIQLQPPL